MWEMKFAQAKSAPYEGKKPAQAKVEPSQRLRRPDVTDEGPARDFDNGDYTIPV